MLEIDLNLGIETRFIFGDYNYIGLRKLYLRRCITTADVIDLVAKHIPYLEVLDCEILTYELIRLSHHTY